MELHCSRRRGRPRRRPTLLMFEHGDMRVLGAIKRLCCKKCRVPAAPVYLRASQRRQFVHGPEPDWAIELVPEPRT